MIDKILNNAGTAVALAFALVGLLLLAVVVLADLIFARRLDPGTFDLMKVVTVSAMSYGLGGGITGAAQARATQRAQAAMAAQLQPGQAPGYPKR